MKNCSIVTGANSGIGEWLVKSVEGTALPALKIESVVIYPTDISAGREVTAGLLRDGHNVVMACRFVDSLMPSCRELQYTRHSHLQQVTLFEGVIVAWSFSPQTEGGERKRHTSS